MQTTSNASKPHPERDLVEIKINRVEYKIPRGPLKVTSLKDLAEIPPADEVEQVRHGNLEPIADDATLEIKGGEKFISHPRDGGSS
jgi:hypothetical protein